MGQPVSISTAEPAIHRTMDLLERLFPSPRRFGIRLWNKTELPVDGRPAFTLVFNHAGALRRIFKPPVELSLGEAFISNDLDIEGDIFSAFPMMKSIVTRQFSAGEIVSLGLSLSALPTSGPARAQGRRPVKLRGAVHSRERDRVAVQYHYDVGNDFYSLWLDRNLQYSCGYFPTGAEDLDAAQERKMEHICRKLRLQPGERLLDIGCGWGGLARYAAKNYGVEVLGVTLSKNQKAYADEQITGAGPFDGVSTSSTYQLSTTLQGRVAVELKDYRDLGDESFDKIVSVGMFEHVGRSHLPEYFAQVYRLLKPAGLFLNHGISRRAGTEKDQQGFIQQRILGRGSFLQHYIFSDAELIPVSDVNVMAENAGFEVRDVENLREHYALTLRNWVNRLETRREEAVKASDDVTYRTWRLYMSASAYGFESGYVNVNQTLLAKMTPEGKSSVPSSRADLYAQ